MKVLVQTRISPIMTVYDSQQPEPSNPGKSSALRTLRRFLKPVIQLQDDSGSPILATGDFYPSLFPLLVLFAVILIGYLIFRR